MFRLLLPVISLILLVGCSLNKRTVHTRPIVTETYVEAGFIATGRSEFFSLLHYETDFKDYQVNNRLLAAASFANYEGIEARLGSDQLKQLRYHPLFVMHSSPLQFQIEHESSLACVANNIATAEQAEQFSLQHYFATNILAQFSRQYQVTLRLVPTKAFFNTHVINPATNDIVFYIKADCESTKILSWYLYHFASILHELAHIEQAWGKTPEQWQVSLPEQKTNQWLSSDKLIREFTAEQIASCALLMPKAIHWIKVRQFGDSRTFSISEATNRILKQVNGSEFSMYSNLGAELANVWLAEHANEDGYIAKANKSQYRLFEQACTDILTEEGITAASDFLHKVLANDVLSEQHHLQFTLP